MKQFDITGSAIQGGFTGDPSQLSFLDLHDGYTPDEARELLGAWGPYGRRLYLLVEGIDCTLYHAGYRGFLVVVANRLAGALQTKWPQAAPLVLLAALPVLLAGVDFLEDAGQVRLFANVQDLFTTHENRTTLHLLKPVMTFTSPDADHQAFDSARIENNFKFAHCGRWQWCLLTKPLSMRTRGNPW